MDRKREMIRALTDAAWSTVDFYSAQADTGVISVETAKKNAIENLRRLRYGPDGKDYFWINDMQPRIIMHPYRPELEGRDTSTLTDPAGKPLFVAFADKVRTDGAGYVDYQWQWQDDPSRIVDKISYVKGFAPWGWVIGSGVYVEDVRAQIETITRHMTVIFIGITIVMCLLSIYIIRQGAISENKRHHSEVSLRESEAKYRLLAETAREIIITFDSDHRITYANPAWRKIYKTEDIPIEGQSLLDFIAPEYVQAFKENVRQATLAVKEDHLLDSAFHMGDAGLPVPIEATLTAMPGTDGKANYLLAARDVTERRKAAERAQMQQEQLYQSAKMASLGTLVAGVAHEINNPISTVVLNVQVFERFWRNVKPILDEYHDGGGSLQVSGMGYDDFSRRMPQLIDYGVERVKRIVGDLKNFSGQSSSDVNEAVNLNEVVTKSVGLVGSSIKQATMDFKAIYAEGLPPEIVNRITDPFFTTKRDRRGTGLGLSISDTIIRDHRGRLEFDSLPGKGTTVTVWIPYGHAAPVKEVTT